MDTKICPFCKEEIKAGAVKCRYCCEFLESLPEHPARPAGQAADHSVSAGTPAAPGDGLSRGGAQIVGCAAPVKDDPTGGQSPAPCRGAEGGRVRKPGRELVPAGRVPAGMATLIQVVSLVAVLFIIVNGYLFLGSSVYAIHAAGYPGPPSSFLRNFFDGGWIALTVTTWLLLGIFLCKFRGGRRLAVPVMEAGGLVALNLLNFITRGLSYDDILFKVLVIIMSAGFLARYVFLVTAGVRMLTCGNRYLRLRALGITFIGVVVFQIFMAVIYQVVYPDLGYTGRLAVWALGIFVSIAPLVVLFITMAISRSSLLEYNGGAPQKEGSPRQKDNIP